MYIQNKFFSKSRFLKLNCHFSIKKFPICIQNQIFESNFFCRIKNCLFYSKSYIWVEFWFSNQNFLSHSKSYFRVELIFLNWNFLFVSKNKWNLNQNFVSVFLMNFRVNIWFLRQNLIKNLKKLFFERSESKIEIYSSLMFEIFLIFFICLKRWVLNANLNP